MPPSERSVPGASGSRAAAPPPGARKFPQLPPGGARPSGIAGPAAPRPRPPPAAPDPPSRSARHPRPAGPRRLSPALAPSDSDSVATLGHPCSPDASRVKAEDGPQMLGTLRGNALRPATQLGLQRKSGFGLAPLVSGRQEGAGAARLELWPPKSSRKQATDTGQASRLVPAPGDCRPPLVVWVPLTGREVCFHSFHEGKHPTFVLAKRRREFWGSFGAGCIRGVGGNRQGSGGLGSQKAGTAGSKLSPPVFLCDTAWRGWAGELHILGDKKAFSM